MELKTCLSEGCHNLFLHTPRARGGGRIREFCERVCYLRQRNINQRINDPEAYKDKYRKASFARYGITEEVYNEILDSQNGRCAVCKSSTPGGKGRFHIDHDHACCPKGRSCGGCVRGLLCHSCNIAAGYLYSDPVRILALLEYVEKRSTC